MTFNDPSPKRPSSTASDLGYTDLHDTELVALCLARDEAAWREFVRRYEPALRNNLRKVMTRALRIVLDSDAIDDVIGDFYLRILQGDMRRLRRWYESDRAADVMTWLTMIAGGIAIDHVRRGFDQMSGRAGAIGKLTEKYDSDHDPNRGANWFEIEDRNMRDPIKKRRNRKSRDDQ